MTRRPTTELVMYRTATDTNARWPARSFARNFDATGVSMICVLSCPQHGLTAVEDNDQWHCRVCGLALETHRIVAPLP